MRFDQFSVALLRLRPDAPQLSDEDAAALQDAHLAHLAELHEQGYLLAAGPLLSGPSGEFRGLSILNVDADRARELAEADPGVRAGRFSVLVLPWMVPSGAMSFSPARFPHSIAEAGAD
jgi:uncharacterized protein